jgi:broad specificity phosphatase PhoE
MAQVLRGEKLTAIYTSPLTRAVEAARPTVDYHRLTIQAREALQEIHFGVLQGRFRDQRDPEAQRLWAQWQHDKAHYHVPGGETFLDLERRVMPCITEILRKEEGGVVLIVGHRHTNRVILEALMRWPRHVCMDIGLRSKYLYEIVVGEKPSIRTICLDENKRGQCYEAFKV